MKYFYVLIMFLFTLSSNAQIWNLADNIITGNFADTEELGHSVAISDDGFTVAVGSPYHSPYGGSPDEGRVQVYRFKFGSWVQLGSSIGPATDNYRNGWSVSLSADGNTVAIGDPEFGASDQGHVRVFRYSANTDWTQLGSDITGEANGDESGSAVSLSSDGYTVAIGARLNAGGGTQRGHARVYQFIGGSWTKIGLDLDGDKNGDQFGWSVSLSGDASTVAVSSVFQDDGNAN